LASEVPAPRPGALWRFVREWVLPVAVGLGVGAGAVFAWLAMRSETEKIVARYHAEEEDLEDLADELRALGAGARDDLFKKFLAIPGRQARWKHWVGQQLVGEPFFGTRLLVEVVRKEGAGQGATEWDQRVAAAVLVDALRRETNPVLVVPPLVRWLEDLSVLDHQLPMQALSTLRGLQLLPPDAEPAVLAALVRLASRDRYAGVTDEDDLAEVEIDRALAVYQLGDFLPAQQVKDLLWGAALDEDEAVQVRANALMALAMNKVFEDPEPWARAARSEVAAVRQTVADNLLRTRLLDYDPVLDALHRDADPLVRMGSVQAQTTRLRPTFLDDFALLVEDHETWVRFWALLGAGSFPGQDVEGHGGRATDRLGMLVRVLEESDQPDEVTAALLALHQLTGGKHFGFRPDDVDLVFQSVEPAAVEGYLRDTEGRQHAVQQWREHLGGVAVWTPADRARALAALATHADPENRALAQAELARLNLRDLDAGDDPVEPDGGHDGDERR
jgi:hypothetical protein